jgi:hypothetical protein
MSRDSVAATSGLRGSPYHSTLIPGTDISGRVAHWTPHEGCDGGLIRLARMNPASRATANATARGSSAAATIRSFSARDLRRRRSFDVITPTCVFVVGLSSELSYEFAGLIPGAQDGLHRRDTNDH